MTQFLEIKSFYTKKIKIAQYIKSLEKLSYYNDEPLSMYMSPMLDNICYEAKKKNCGYTFRGGRILAPPPPRRAETIKPHTRTYKNHTLALTKYYHPYYHQKHISLCSPRR